MDEVLKKLLVITMMKNMALELSDKVQTNTDTH